MKEPKNLKEALEIIDQQDQMIGKLTRENERLEESQRKRREWLDRAKKEAGYDRSVSFDIVWKQVLEKANTLQQM